MVTKREVENNLRWHESKCGKFLVESLYSFLSRAHSVSFPASIVWRTWAPLKVSFFAWEASWVESLLSTSSRGDGVYQVMILVQRCGRNDRSLAS